MHDVASAERAGDAARSSQHRQALFFWLRATSRQRNETAENWRIVINDRQSGLNAGLVAWHLSATYKLPCRRLDLLCAKKMVKMASKASTDKIIRENITDNDALHIIWRRLE